MAFLWLLMQLLVLLCYYDLPKLLIELQEETVKDQMQYSVIDEPNPSPSVQPSGPPLQYSHSINSLTRLRHSYSPHTHSPRTHTDSQRTYTDSQRTHTDSQRTHTDSQRTHTDSQRTHTDSQRTHTDSQRTHTDSQRTHTDSQRTRTDSQRTHTDSQRTHTDSKRTHTDLQRTHTDSQRTHTDSQRTHADAHKSFKDSPQINRDSQKENSDLQKSCLNEPCDEKDCDSNCSAQRKFPSPPHAIVKVRQPGADIDALFTSSNEMIESAERYMGSSYEDSVSPVRQYPAIMQQLADGTHRQLSREEYIPDGAEWCHFTCSVNQDSSSYQTDTDSQEVTSSEQPPPPEGASLPWNYYYNGKGYPIINSTQC